ncbi:MAG: FtsQ-type POTRA domain-containing protein [Candidatus Neomarinimicrobiota bacterium]
MGSLKIRIKHLGRWLRTALTVALAITIGSLLGNGILSYAEKISIFELRRIEVRGNRIISRAEIINAIDLPLTGSIFDVDLAGIQRRVERLNYIHGVRLGRIFPHTIFVDILENQPLAYVAAPEFFVLTVEGTALPLPYGRFDLELPTVSGIPGVISALDAGVIEGSEQLVQAREMLDYLRTAYPVLYQELSEIVFSAAGEVTLYLAETSTAVRLGDTDLQQRIATLDAFLTTIMGQRNVMDYSYIDLRYKQQIIVRERA